MREFVSMRHTDNNIYAPASLPPLTYQNFCNGQLLLIQLSPWIAAKSLSHNTGYWLAKLVTRANWQWGETANWL